ncbi:MULTISPECIES: SMI1/KNR4 family protein [unclassified Exiguobacterium]|uniref:SMI1/KNR4 family protein n=1 Tax=unclassified Exiguobacterium TaxID=2644629 RepID=UPI001BE8B054|nr:MULTISPECIES: SMI1/KNR4 family protein [unclassified Exiguobacterium]
MIIWNDIPDDPNRLPTLTEEVLKEVETRLGVKLPDDYLESIRIQNGGYVEQRDLPIKWNGQDDIALVDSISGVGLHNGLIESKALLTEWGVEDERLIAFAGDGHFFLAFDYREGTTPKIAYIDTDTEEIDVLFDSFSQFSEAITTVDMGMFAEMIPESITEMNQGKTLLDDARRLLYSNHPEEKIDGAIIWFNGLDSLEADELVRELFTWVNDKVLRDTAISVIQEVIIRRKPLHRELYEAFFEMLRQQDDRDSKQRYEETMYILDNDIRVE